MQRHQNVNGTLSSLKKYIYTLIKFIEIEEGVPLRYAKECPLKQLTVSLDYDAYHGCKVSRLRHRTQVMFHQHEDLLKGNQSIALLVEFG